MAVDIIKAMLIVFISLQNNGIEWLVPTEAKRRDNTTIKQNCKTRTLCSLTLEDIVMYYTEPLDGALCNFVDYIFSQILKDTPNALCI